MNTSSGEQLLQEIKANAHRRNYRIPVGAAFALVPVAVTPPHLDAAQVRCLTDWRNRHVKAFLHEFVATEQRTADWLANVVRPDSTRILFVLENSQRAICASLGLAYIDWVQRSGEADAIVRGTDLPRGTMRAALQSLLSWSQSALALTRWGVRVFADNPACEFYRKVGFREIRREGLSRRPVVDGVRWEPDSEGPADRSLVHLVYEPSSIDEPLR